MQLEKLALMNSGRRAAMDVAGAIAMVKGSELGKLIIMGRAAEDGHSVDALRSMIAGLMLDKFPKYAEGLALAITNEVICPNHCRNCRGRGWVYSYKGDRDLSLIAKNEIIELDEISCECCDGRGLDWFPNKYRARIAGIDWRTWRRNEFGELVKLWSYELEKEAGDAAKKFAKQ